MLEHFIGINFLIRNDCNQNFPDLNNIITNFSTFKELNKELDDIQNYINIVFNSISIDKGKIFYPTHNPKISIVITVYNGEGYLKTALLSIQNQDFKDIEIIMVDDGSLDKSVQLIRELMAKEPRIVLYQNKENKGMLYTKTKGILSAKGKYILLLDEDDIFIQRDAFSTLYQQAEKNNLDLLGFKLIISKPKLKKLQIKRIKIEPPIIFQPELSEKMFKHISREKIKKIGGYLTNYFVKTNILIKVIKQIDEKILNVKMNFHDDYVLFFLLTRNAHNLQKIDRFFYLVLRGWNTTNQNIKFRNQEKSRNRKYMRCNSLLNFIEFILKNTKNTYYDKKIAFYSYNRWFLSYWCRNFNATLERAIYISRLYLKDKYIEDKDKFKIKKFLSGIKIRKF